MAREFEIVSNPQFRNLHVFLVRMLSRTPHIHRELELGYVLRGEAALRIGGEDVHLRARDGYLIRPLEVHEFHAEARDAMILAVQISPRIFEGFLTEAPTLRYGGGALLRGALKDADADRRLFAMCLALARLYLTHPRGYECDCFALTADILALLERSLPSEGLTQEAWLPLRRRMERFAAILDHIDENFRRKLLLEEIAQIEGLTMPYLSHLFRDTLGMPFQEYLKKKRFEYARSLLLGTRRSLLDISLESGFSDARYMIRMFEEEFGCSPREYRRKNAPRQAAESGAQATTQTILGAEEALRALRAAEEEFGGAGSEREEGPPLKASWGEE